MKFFVKILFGGITGFLNGLLGAGGGMVAIPILRKEIKVKEAHATCIAIILPMSVVSSISYIMNGAVKIGDVFPYLPGGIIGAFVGIMLLKRIEPVFIKKLFALVMLWAGFRMVFV